MEGAFSGPGLQIGESGACTELSELLTEAKKGVDSRAVG
jgi:hypothetical protein